MSAMGKPVIANFICTQFCILEIIAPADAILLLNDQNKGMEHGRTGWMLVCTQLKPGKISTELPNRM